MCHIIKKTSDIDARPKGNLSFCFYVCRCFLSLRSSSAAGCYGVSRETRRRRRRRRRRSSVNERRQRGQEDEVGSGAEPGQHQVNREHGHNSKKHMSTLLHTHTQIHISYVSVRLPVVN